MLLMGPKKRDAATLIVAGLTGKKPKKGEHDDFVQRPDEGPSGDEGYATLEDDDPEVDAKAAIENAMRKFADAVEKKDYGAMADYLKEAVYLCQDEAHGDDAMEE